jgi:hypothetical protein
MILHHSRAILVSEQTSIPDPRVGAPYGQIVSSEQEEVGLMKRMLEERSDRLLGRRYPSTDPTDEAE